MDNKDILGQEYRTNFLASGNVSPINPLIPTAKYDRESPFFISSMEREKEYNLTEQIRSGRAGVAFLGDRDKYSFYSDRDTDPITFGNLGMEYSVKFDPNSSKGWGETNVYGRDAVLEFLDGGTKNYFWNPADLDDPTNIESTYWSSFGEGFSKVLFTPENDIEFERRKQEIQTQDPNWNESLALQETDEFLAANEGVAKVLAVGNVNLYDYTRPSKNRTGHRFAINNAVIDALQNIRLSRWSQDNNAGGKLFDALYYGIQDPLMVRDIAATTVATLGLGTLQVGSARLAGALGEATVAGSRALGVARAATKALQFTSPLTGPIEGVAYKALQSTLSNVGKSPLKTVVARGLAIGTEAGIAGGVSAYQDEKNRYEWQELITDKGDVFKPDWSNVVKSSAMGFTLGGGMLGIMRFGLGAIGDMKYIAKKDWTGYWRNVTNSLDNWATTDKGLTVFGDTLSDGRGVLFGDMVDSYMKKNVDNRDFASIMLNGTRLYNTAVFNPAIAAKASFDGTAAAKVATEYEKVTGLPGEIIQRLEANHPARVLFDNLTDPEFLKHAGITYDSATNLMKQINDKKLGVVGPTPSKAVAEIDIKNKLQLISEVFRMEVARNALTKSEISMTDVEAKITKETGRGSVNFANEVDRDNFVFMADVELQKATRSKVMDILRYASPGRGDLVLPDGTTIPSATMTEVVRGAFGLDDKATRIFFNDSHDGRKPTFAVSIDPDGTLNMWSSVFTKDDKGRLGIEIKTDGDYKPENIRNIRDFQEGVSKVSDEIKKINEEAKKTARSEKKKKIRELSPESADILEKVGKDPTNKVLARHFGLDSKEATALSVVMDIMGLDLETIVLKIARAKGKVGREMEAANATASIEFFQIKEGVQALIRSTEHSDFGSMVHEMGHYNRMLFINNTEEGKAFRQSIGISDELWDKFSDWVGYKGTWENDLSKATKEQLKAEEKFANAWAFYIRNIMVGDGKTNATGLHRLFSAFGDHLGNVGNKFKTQIELEKGLDFSPIAKEVYEKLFLRSQANLTKFWETALTGVFKDLTPDQKAVIGEAVLGAEAWNTWKAKKDAEAIKAASVAAPIAEAASVVKKEPKVDLVGQVMAKFTGEAFEPTTKAIRLALKAKLSPEQITAQVSEILSKINGEMPESPLRNKASADTVKARLASVTDEELEKLTEGSYLAPKVITWVFDESTNKLDVSYSVVKLTDKQIAGERTRRLNRKKALETIAEAEKKLEAPAEVKPSGEKAEVKPSGEKAEVKPSGEKITVETPDDKLVGLTLEEITNLPVGATFVYRSQKSGTKYIGVVTKVTEQVGKRWLTVKATEPGRVAPKFVTKNPEWWFKNKPKILKPATPVETAAAVEADIAAKKEAVSAIIEAKKTLDRTDVVPESSDGSVTATDAMAILRPSEVVVDSAGVPVHGLTKAEERAIVVTAIEDTAVVQANQNIENLLAGQPLVDSPAVPTTVVVGTAAPKINEEKLAQLEVSANNSNALADEALAKMPDEVAEVAVDLSKVRYSEAMIRELVDIVVSQERLPKIDPEVLRDFFRARLRYLTATDLITKFGNVEREEQEIFMSIPDKVRADMLDSVEVDLAPNNPTKFREALINFGITKEQLDVFISVTKKRREGAIEASKEADRKLLVELEGSFNLWQQGKEKLAEATTKEEKAEATKLIKANESKAGRYSAAAERLASLEEEGVSIRSVDRQKVEAKVINEIMTEGRISRVSNKTVAQPLISKEDAIAAQYGVQTQIRSIHDLGIKDLFQDPVETKTVPMLRNAKVPRKVGNVAVDMNATRLLAATIFDEIVNRGAVAIIKAGGIREFANSITPAAALKRTSELGFAPLQDNPGMYHAIQAILLNSFDDLRYILNKTDATENDILTILNKKAKPFIPARPDGEEDITDVRFAYLLLDNKNITERMLKILSIHDVAPTTLIARLYKTKSGIIEYFRTKLKLPEDTKPVDVLRAVEEWSVTRGESSILTGSLKNTASRLGINEAFRGSRKTQSGEAANEDAIGAFGTVTRDERIEQTEYVESSLSIDIKDVGLADVIQGLFFEYLRGKTASRENIPLSEYWAARIASAAEDGDYTEKIILFFKKNFNKDLTVDQVRGLDTKLNEQLQSFLRDVTDSNKQQDLLEKRLGLKKAGGRLNQAMLDEDKKVITNHIFVEALYDAASRGEVINAGSVIRLIKEHGPSNLKLFLEDVESRLPEYTDSIKKLAVMLVEKLGPAEKYTNAYFLPADTLFYGSKATAHIKIHGESMARAAAAVGIKQENPLDIFIHEYIHALSFAAIDFMGLSPKEEISTYQGWKAWHETELPELLKEQVRMGTISEENSQFLLEQVYNYVNDVEKQLDDMGFFDADLADEDMNFWNGLSILVDETFGGQLPYSLSNFHEYLSEALFRKEFVSLGEEKLGQVLGVLGYVYDKLPVFTQKATDRTYTYSTSKPIRSKLINNYLRFQEVAEVGIYSRHLKHLSSNREQIKNLTDNLKAANSRLIKQISGRVYQAPDTPAFKKFFGNSKVVQGMSYRGSNTPDAPLMMKHGSPTAGFTEWRFDFDTSRDDLLFGNGAYFTEDNDIARTYQRGAPRNKIGTKVYDWDAWNLDRINAASKKINNEYGIPRVNEVLVDIAKKVLGLTEEESRTYSNYLEYVVDDTKLNIGAPKSVNKFIASIEEDLTAAEIELTKIDNLTPDQRAAATDAIIDGFMEYLEVPISTTGFGPGTYNVWLSIQKPIDADNDRFTGNYLLDIVNRLPDSDDKTNLVDLVKFTFRKKQELKENSDIQKLVEKTNSKNNRLLFVDVGDRHFAIPSDAVTKVFDDEDVLAPYAMPSSSSRYYRSSDLADDNEYVEVRAYDLTAGSFAQGEWRELTDTGKQVYVSLAELEKHNVYTELYIDEIKIDGDLRSVFMGNKEIYFDEFFKDAKALDQEHTLIKAFMKDGYDGLTHIGGLRRGGGEKLHRVFIAWHKNQIKDINNVGTFSKETNNILYQSNAYGLFKQEQTPDFIAVTKNQEPLELFHNSEGTGPWQPDKLGLWFSSNKDVSKKFGKKSYSAYVKLTKQNTLVVSTDQVYLHDHIPVSNLPINVLREIAKLQTEKVASDSYTAFWEDKVKLSDSDLASYFTGNVDFTSDTIAEAAKKVGYSGVYFPKLREGGVTGDQWVVFNKSDILPITGENTLLLQGKIDDTTQAMIDAADLRRRALLQRGYSEETTPEVMEIIQRLVNGLTPVDLQPDAVTRRMVGDTQMRIAQASKTFTKPYRKLDDAERREFVSTVLIPRIREVMGDRNVSASMYSSVSDTTFGKKVNSLIGGAVNYADTADSQSILLQFISKIFDPMMDLRDGEIKNKFNLFSVDKLNAEVNGMLLRSGLIQTGDKIVRLVKDREELTAINDLAWLYATRPDELPADVKNRELVLEAIKSLNEFNKLTVSALSEYGSLGKGVDPTEYGTMHIANQFAKENQKGFADALTNWATAKAQNSDEVSVITASALGWLKIKRDSQTDNIVAVKILKESPLGVLVEDNQLNKWLDWNGKTKNLFSDSTKLAPESLATLKKALVSNADYTDDWKSAYGSRGENYTAIRQSMEIARDRYLGIDLGDTKSAAPKRMAIGGSTNYDEMRIISHDELSRNPELSRFFNKDIFDLAHTQLRSRVTDAVMTKYVSEFFGVRMSMEDLITILSTIGEEVEGRAHMSISEINSRERGYERVRNAWLSSIGRTQSSKDSVDKYYKVLLDNSRIPLTLASGLRAALTSTGETARALLASDKNRPMLMQLLPNVVKLARLIGRRNRLGKKQMLSATHWLRGLSTDHLLHRNGVHPENPFQGVVFGAGASGYMSSFVNGWRAAGLQNRTEELWLSKLMNRLSPVSTLAGAPLAFVNDVTTTLHIWNAQENFTKNTNAMLKMAEAVKKDPTNYSAFAQYAKQCGLQPREAVDLSTAGLLDPKYISAIAEMGKNQSLYTDGILDIRKMYTWAGEDGTKIEAITRMAGYINMTVRHTNAEPTLLDIRVSQSIYGRTLGQYMQFMLSMGIQEIGRRRRTSGSGYSKHLIGLMMMEATAYGMARALSDVEDEEKGGYDEFINNPFEYTIRTATSLPLLGSYAFWGSVMRSAIMSTSEYLGGPSSSQEFRVPDLISGPASTAPRRLTDMVDTPMSWYNSAYEIITD